MGYGIPEVWVFVESLRRHYAGDIALLVTSRSPAPLLAYLRSRNVRPIFFDCTFWMVAHVQIGRFVRYADFLRECERPYERIFLTDVRDVLFQSHPFIGSPAGDLTFFLEDSRMTIGQCQSNSTWVQNVFGLEALRQLAGKRIACSGTTMGSHGAILRYLDTLLSYAPPQLTSKLVGTRGEDQGIHNFILHTAALPGIQTSENHAFISNLCHVPPAEIRILPDGISAAGCARPPAIIHQYNYHGETLAFVAREYPLAPAGSPRG